MCLNITETYMKEKNIHLDYLVNICSIYINIRCRNWVFNDTDWLKKRHRLAQKHGNFFEPIISIVYVCVCDNCD